MLSVRSITRRPAAAFAAAGGAGACLYGYVNSNLREQTALCEGPKVKPASLEEVAKRLGVYVKNMDENEKLSLRKDNQNVKIYGLKNEDAHKNAGGLPIVRAAHTIIKAPLEEVSLCWWQASRRKDWDSVNTKECRNVKSLSETSRLVYLQGKPKKGGVISSRDFCYVMYNAPPDLVGAKPGSKLYVQANNAEGVPPNKGSTRGDVNSLLLLEAIDPTTTKASYAIEMDVKGWLPVAVVKSAADETPLTLAVLRAHIEEAVEEESRFGPEASRKHALARRSSRLVRTDTNIAGPYASQQQLRMTRKNLEDRLKILEIQARRDGRDITSLRNEIEHDIAQIDKRL